MAKNTSPELRNLNIYTVFIRNFTENGTINALHTELDRIKFLGTDIICFLPFYPVGIENRKGKLGSPYAVKDHSKVDPALGTIEDFKRLVTEIHKRDMKVMIQIVLNHTSVDSKLKRKHPEWFYKKEDGSFGNRYGEWEDINDLDYNNLDLWVSQIKMMRYWAEIVDGFHCNFAPVIPLKFWRLARREISKIKPNFIWLAQSIENNFMRELRSLQIVAYSEAEMFQEFDIIDEYDVYDDFLAYLKGEVPLSYYIHAMNIQETIFPSNYVKAQFLENHDKERIPTFLQDIDNLVQWTAFKHLQKGAVLMSNGQEVAAVKRISLIDKDSINWQTGIDLSSFISRLSFIKKNYIPSVNVYHHMEAYNELDSVVMYYNDSIEKRIGVFNLKHQEGHIPVNAPDGEYENLINEEKIIIRNGTLDIQSTPCFFIY